MSPEQLATSADSLLHRRPDLRSAWPTRIAEFPADRRHLLAVADGVCESGIEFLFFLRLRDHIPLRRQVPVSGIGRVDFLIGERLIVEIDGSEYHSGHEAFASDRRRDAALVAAGYRVLRFSYFQIVSDWPAVWAAVVTSVSRGDHH